MAEESHPKVYHLHARNTAINSFTYLFGLDAEYACCCINLYDTCMKFHMQWKGNYIAMQIMEQCALIHAECSF